MTFNLHVTNRFKRQFESLSPDIKKVAQKKIEFLSMNPRHPSLQVHKVEGTKGNNNGDVFETYITKKYRMTWEYGPSNQEITLRNIDNYDECLDNP